MKTRLVPADPGDSTVVVGPITAEQAQTFLVVGDDFELPKRITDAMDEVASRVLGHPVRTT